MVYGFETMALKKKQVEEIEVAEMKMLRVTMEVTRKDKIRNEYIRGTVKVEWLGMTMREGRLRWYGHVVRSRVAESEVLGRSQSWTVKYILFNSDSSCPISLHISDVNRTTYAAACASAVQ